MPVIDQHELLVFDASGVELDPLEDAGTLTADRGWSPHVQGQVSVRPPASSASTAPGAKMIVELTQRFGSFALTRDLSALYGGDTTADMTTAFGGGTTADLTALITSGSWNTPVRAATGRRFELMITGRTRSRDVHRLELSSAEVIIQDWLWYDVDVNKEGLPVTFTAETCAQFLTAVIAAHSAETLGVGTVYGGVPPILDQSTPRAISPTSHTIETGEGTIATLQAFLAATRQRLYSPGNWGLVLTDYPYTHPASITVEPGVNLIDFEVTDARDVTKLVRFQGTATDPDARPIYSSAAFPEVRWPHEEIVDAPHTPILTTGLADGITAATEPYFRRIGLDESPLRLVTINDYSVMPGSEVEYTLPDEAEETDVIDAITWQLGGTWRMTIWI